MNLVREASGMPHVLAARCFVDGDGVGQIDTMEVLLGNFVPRTIERAQQGVFPVRAQDAVDFAQRAIPQLFLVVVLQLWFVSRANIAFVDRLDGLTSPQESATPT